MVKELSIYDELSNERKELQEQGKLPKWCTTIAWQMLKEKNLSPEYPDLASVYNRIAKHAAKYTPNPAEWQPKFFELLWNGWLAASTPVLSNMGTGFGCPVSCSGGYIGDSVYDFYGSQQEAAVLSKNGFGTSGYLGAIRPRGAKITGVKGGASGVLPVFKDFVQMSRDISQGSQRRGAWAGYIEIDHPDFYEIVNYISKNPDDANIGWNVTDKFIEQLEAGDNSAIARYQAALKLKMITGKGYFFFVDRVNVMNPQMYRDRGLDVKASNLCVTGDTIVHIRIDDIEAPVQIGSLSEIVNQDIPIEVLSYNIEQNKNEWKQITNFALTKKDAKLIKVTDTISGKTLTCTPCHKVYTKNRGYIEASNLMHDDILVIN